MKAEQQYIDLFAQCEDLVCRESSGVMNAPRAVWAFPPRGLRIIAIRMSVGLSHRIMA